MDFGWIILVVIGGNNYTRRICERVLSSGSHSAATILNRIGSLDFFSCEAIINIDLFIIRGKVANINDDISL